MIEGVAKLIMRCGRYSQVSFSTPRVSEDVVVSGGVRMRLSEKE